MVGGRNGGGRGGGSVTSARSSVASDASDSSGDEENGDHLLTRAQDAARASALASASVGAPVRASLTGYGGGGGGGEDSDEEEGELDISPIKRGGRPQAVTPRAGTAASQRLAERAAAREAEAAAHGPGPGLHPPEERMSRMRQLLARLSKSKAKGKTSPNAPKEKKKVKRSKSLTEYRILDPDDDEGPDLTYVFPLLFALKETPRDPPLSRRRNLYVKTVCVHRYAELRKEDEKKARADHARSKREELLAQSKAERMTQARLDAEELDRINEFKRQQEVTDAVNRAYAREEWEAKKRASESMQEMHGQLRRQFNNTLFEQDQLANKMEQHDLRKHMIDEKKRFDDFQRDDANRVKIEGFKLIKERKKKEWAQKEVLANEKIQGELIKHMRDEREAFDKEWTHKAKVVEAEGLKQLRERKRREYLQVDVLANEKIQGELIKHMRKEREAFDKEWTHKAKVVEAEGLKQLRERKHKEYLQVDVLANEKIQGQLIKHMRDERKRFDDFQRDDASRVKIEGLRLQKAQRIKEEAAKDVLANSRLQAEVIRQQKASRDAFDKEMREEADRVKIEGLKYYNDAYRHAAKKQVQRRPHMRENERERPGKDKVAGAPAGSPFLSLGSCAWLWRRGDTCFSFRFLRLGPFQEAEEMASNRLASRLANQAMRDQKRRDDAMKSHKTNTLAEAARIARNEAKRNAQAHEQAMRDARKPMGRQKGVCATRQDRTRRHRHLDGRLTINVRTGCTEAERTLRAAKGGGRDGVAEPRVSLIHENNFLICVFCLSSPQAQRLSRRWASPRGGSGPVPAVARKPTTTASTTAAWRGATTRWRRCWPWRTCL